MQADNSDTLCKVLDKLMASSEVTQDFVFLNVVGKVVKALRGSTHEPVRNKVLSLLAALVQRDKC